MLNSKTKYRNKNTAWDSDLLLKSRELAHYLFGKRKTLDFMKPAYQVERDDSDDMKQNAQSGKTFSLNSHVRERLENWVGIT